MQKIEYYYSLPRQELMLFTPDVIKRSLDVGCAAGFFSENLKKEKNTETWGIEMVEDVAKIAKTKLDKVLVGTFEDVCDELPKNYFDCIFFNDVLEHMPYPEDCLKKIRDNITPDGCIIASLPNIRHIDILLELVFKGDWKYRDSGILDRTHLRFFTKKSILRMFNDCGYKVEQIKGIAGIKPFSLISIINIIAFNRLKDLKYKQFAIVASLK